MLTLITSKKEISDCQKAIEVRLKKALKRSETLAIGYQGGNFKNIVYYDDSLWFSTTTLKKNVKIPRYWNAFGEGKRDNGNQIITVEVNPALTGNTKQVAGMFAKDNVTGECFLLHRGIIGGGKEGIGKDAFKSWYRGSWVKVHDDKNKEEAILISSIASPLFTDKLKLFVSEVAKFKKEITNGINTRGGDKVKGTAAFDPEFHGLKKGKRKSEFEYVSNHGLIVNTLDEHIQKTLKTGQSTFNTALIDLGVYSKNTVIKIYEVKTSNNRQSIYTGIGQLMFHSRGNEKIEKYIVLPDDDYQGAFSKILKEIGVKLIKYSLSKGKVVFKA